jgi:hypothetical protein
MYVLSSMPTNKQSIAGSLLQTLTRLCTAVGYGIATAIFDAVQNNPSGSGYYANNAIEPFAAVFWFTVGCAFIGTLFVPFLTIGTQGHKGDTGRVKIKAEDTLGLDDGHTVVANGKSMEQSLGEEDR